MRPFCACLLAFAGLCAVLSLPRLEVPRVFVDHLLDAPDDQAARTAVAERLAALERARDAAADAGDDWEADEVQSEIDGLLPRLRP